jgi:hypothetical protein
MLEPPHLAFFLFFFKSLLVCFLFFFFFSFFVILECELWASHLLGKCFYHLSLPPAYLGALEFGLGSGSAWHYLAT